MKPIIFKFILALFLGMSVISGANAIDLYVNTKTKQIFTEAGPDRERIGTFERVEDRPVQAATPAVLPPRNRNAELEIKAKASRLAKKVDLLGKEILKARNIKVKQLISKVDSLEAKLKRSNNVKVTLDQKGLQAESADGNFKFKIGGRMHADASVSGNDNFSKDGSPAEANNGTEMRRARLTFKSTFHKVWKFKSDIDFANNEVAIKDLKLAYTGLKIFEDIKTRITVGHQKQAFSRELQESSNDYMYTERSLMNILNAPVVDRAIGVNIAAHGKKWTAQTGVYGESISPNNTSKDEGWGVNGRATFNPILNNDNGIQKLIHLGLAGNYRETSNSATNSRGGIRYKYETTQMSNLYPIDTGTITTVKSLKMVGLEANGVYGPVSVGGEFTQSWMDRNNGMSSLAFHGWYGEAALTLTGESRTYKNGVFKRLKPKSTFSLANGGLGAWEIAARVGGINMNDGAYKGGSMKNFSFALNWYANENVRLMFGYDRIIDINNSPLISRTSGGKPDGLNTFMFRTQIAI
jgi:phosphate-selective porin OprO and OprP